VYAKKNTIQNGTGFGTSLLIGRQEKICDYKYQNNVYTAVNKQVAESQVVNNRK